MKNGKGSLLTYISLVGVLVFGLVYLLKPSFMPYHADAVSMSWEQVPYDFQQLIWAIMKAASGGWIALGIVFGFLQFKFSQNRELWIPYLILAGGLIFGAASLIATIVLAQTTPADPPYIPVMIIMLFMLLGFFFNLRYASSGS